MINLKEFVTCSEVLDDSTFTTYKINGFTVYTETNHDEKEKACLSIFDRDKNLLICAYGKETDIRKEINRVVSL